MSRAAIGPHDVTIALFRGARSRRVRSAHVDTWQEFTQHRLPDLLERTALEKTALPAFILAPVDEKRSDATVGAHTALVIDVDTLPGTRDEFLRRCMAYTCAVYESPSSRVGENGTRLRVIAALATPLPTPLVKAARRAFARDLGLDPVAAGVTKADAIAQIMFIGRVDGTSTRRHWVYEGVVWSPPADLEPEAPKAPRGHGTGPVSADRSADELPPVPPELVAAIEAPEGELRQGGRDLMRGLGGYWARRGYHPDAIEAAVLELPSSQPDKRATEAREAAEQFYAGDPATAGATEVERHFSEALGEAQAGAVLAALEASYIAPAWVLRIAEAARTQLEAGADVGTWRRALMAWAGVAEPDTEAAALRAMPSWVRRHVRASREALRTPLGMNLAVALGALSSCVQGRVIVRMNPTWAEHTGLYVCSVADSGEKKSPAFRLATGAIAEWERERREQGKEAYVKAVSARSDLEKELKWLEKNHTGTYGGDDDDAPEDKRLTAVRIKLEDPPPVRFKYLAENCTPEKLTELLANHGRIAFQSCEAAGIFNILASGYKDKSDLDAWLKAYDGEWVRIERMGREAAEPRYEATTLSANLMTQLSVFTDAVHNPAFRGQGLVQRMCWWVAAPRTAPRWAPGEEAEPVPADVAQRYARKLRRMLELSTREVTLSPEAHTASIAWRDQIERRSLADLAYMRDWLGKHEGRTARIAGILWAADGASGDITADQYARAVAVARWLLECAAVALRVKRVETAEAHDEFADRVLELIDAGACTYRDLRGKCSRAQRGKLRAVLDALIASGDVEEERGVLSVRTQ